MATILYTYKNKKTGHLMTHKLWPARSFNVHLGQTFYRDKDISHFYDYEVIKITIDTDNMTSTIISYDIMEHEYFIKTVVNRIK